MYEVDAWAEVHVPPSSASGCPCTAKMGFVQHLGLHLYSNAWFWIWYDRGVRFRAFYNPLLGSGGYPDGRNCGLQTPVSKHNEE